MNETPDEVDPLAHVKVGDPDPMPAESNERVCAERYRGYACTRPPAHPGQHIAATPFKVVQTWSS